jgi:hypothetical protein
MHDDCDVALAHKNAVRHFAMRSSLLPLAASSDFDLRRGRSSGKLLDRTSEPSSADASALPDIPTMLAARNDLNAYKTASGSYDAARLAIGDLDRSGAVTNADFQFEFTLIARPAQRMRSAPATTHTASCVAGQRISRRQPRSELPTQGSAKRNTSTTRQPILPEAEADGCRPTGADGANRAPWPRDCRSTARHPPTALPSYATFSPPNTAANIESWGN